MAKKLSPAAIAALKEALASVYWYRDDLKSFLYHAMVDKAFLAGINWSLYKRQVAAEVVDTLVGRGDAGIGDLTRLCVSLAEMDSFEHLRRLEDGESKAKNAKEAVAALRKYVAPHQRKTSEEENVVRRQQIAIEKNRTALAISERLSTLLKKYQILVTSRDAQGRGFELERLMFEVFKLFDLDPKASFRSAGEQVDGAFSLDGTDYLFEGKWVASPVEAADLDIFRGKLARKLDNTLGLFLAVNGFNASALALRSPGREVLLLMDGADLMAVLEGRIDLTNLIVRKRRHAAQTGATYIAVRSILDV